MFAKVRRAIDALEAISRGLDPACLDGRDAAALVEDAARGERICAAIKARAARRVDETKAWREDGHRSAAHFVAAAAGTTVGAASRALDAARALDELPATDEAFRRGELSETQVAEITSAAEAEPSAEEELLATPAEQSVKGLRDRARQVRAGAEVDDQAWARRLHVDRRAYEWTEPDGAYCVQGRMAPDAGAQFSAAWNAHIERIFKEARAAGRRESRAAYAADALVALATEGPCKPVDFRLEVSAAAIPRGHTEPGERCEINGTPVPVTIAQSLLDDARVTVLLRDGDDITAVSKPTRTIPARLRKMLEADYPTCGVTTCANDLFLEIDHVVPLADGGQTEACNLWRLCPHHHHLKTYRGWVVVGEPGHWDLVPPDDPDPP